MGVYSLNRTNLSYYDESEIIADESYNGVAGCYQAMIDMEANSHAIFEETIQRDFLEASYIHEGKDEEDIYALQEASVAGIFDRIKAFVKKVWEKIKGIFKNFIAKIHTTIGRDNKALLKKYQKEILKKDRSKVKYKWCNPTGKLESDVQDAVEGGKLKPVAEGVLKSVSNKGQSALFKKIKDAMDDGDYYDNVIKSIGIDAEYKTMEKDIHELCFDSAESEEGVSSQRLNAVFKDMEGDKTVQNIEKAQKQTNKYFANIMSDLDKASSAAAKLKLSGKDDDNFSGDGGNIIGKNGVMYNVPGAPDDVKGVKYSHGDKNGHGVEGPKGYSRKELMEEYVTNAGVAQQAIQQIESVHNRLVACFLREHKFQISQSKKLFSKLASYNPKAKNEAAELYYDAVAEAAEFELNMEFEAY